MSQPVQVVIQPTTPIVTLDRFSEMTGIPVGTIKKRIAAGVIPIVPKQKRGEDPYINLVAFYAKLAACQTSIAAPATTTRRRRPNAL